MPIERVLPTMLGLQILAPLRIAPVIGLLKGPAVGNRVVDIGRGRKRVRRNIFDVVRIRIETMTKLAISSEGELRFGEKRGTKFRKTWQPRARFHARGSDVRNLNRYNL